MMLLKDLKMKKKIKINNETFELNIVGVPPF